MRLKSRDLRFPKIIMTLLAAAMLTTSFSAIAEPSETEKLEAMNKSLENMEDISTSLEVEIFMAKVRRWENEVSTDNYKSLSLALFRAQLCQSGYLLGKLKERHDQFLERLYSAAKVVHRKASRLAAEKRAKAIAQSGSKESRDPLLDEILGGSDESIYDTLAGELAAANVALNLLHRSVRAVVYIQYENASDKKEACRDATEVNLKVLDQPAPKFDDGYIERLSKEISWTEMEPGGSAVP